MTQRCNHYIEQVLNNTLSLSLSLALGLSLSLSPYIYIYIYIYIYKYKVNEECEYLMNESSMHGYLIQNIPAEQIIYFLFKKQEI